MNFNYPKPQALDRIVPCETHTAEAVYRVDADGQVSQVSSMLMPLDKPVEMGRIETAPSNRPGLAVFRAMDMQGELSDWFAMQLYAVGWLTKAGAPA
jgi:hypothetical protein